MWKRVGDMPTCGQRCYCCLTCHVRRKSASSFVCLEVCNILWNRHSRIIMVPRVLHAGPSNKVETWPATGRNVHSHPRHLTMMGPLQWGTKHDCKIGPYGRYWLYGKLSREHWLCVTRCDTLYFGFHVQRKEGSTRSCIGRVRRCLRHWGTFDSIEVILHGSQRHSLAANFSIQAGIVELESVRQTRVANIYQMGTGAQQKSYGLQLRHLL